MDDKHIIAEDQIPDNSITIAHHKNLDELISIREQLEPYLCMAYSHNKLSSLYHLHLIFKQTVKFSGKDVKDDKMVKEDIKEVVISPELEKQILKAVSNMKKGKVSKPISADELKDLLDNI